jgi:hypothetical protein
MARLDECISPDHCGYSLSSLGASGQNAQLRRDTNHLLDALACVCQRSLFSHSVQALVPCPIGTICGLAKEGCKGFNSSIEAVRNTPADH